MHMFGFRQKVVQSPPTLEQNTLRAIADSMATIEFEPTGTVISANPLFLSVTGYQLDEIQGETSSHFLFKRRNRLTTIQQILAIISSRLCTIRHFQTL